MCALLVSVITLSGAANRSFRTEVEQWNPIGFTQAQSGPQTTNCLTAGSAILPTVATAAPSGVLRGGSTNEITFTTAKAVGEEISLYMEYSGDTPTLSGATGTPKSGEWITYTLKSQTVTITGDVTVLNCTDNQLTALDVSKNTALTELYCYNNQLTALDVSPNTALTNLDCSGNQIKGEEMTRLVNSLPDRTGKDAGKFSVVQEPALEGNICLKSDVAIAKGKNWNTQKYKTDTEEYVAYEGAEEGQTLKVTLTKEGEGTITATGATDLNAVPLGTELTIVATPADGYGLKALTANGTDILATKKFTVTADTEVKAIFAKTFAVTLTKEGEGTINATGADNLNAVKYGTELTIIATPADGYVLKALTANGTDILATKKFTVTADTEVKAIFAKPYAVTLTKEGEGTLTATGAADLNAVPEGTELTIVATPTDGYGLKALTANGTDILATKKFTVTADTEVKATFAKTYAVTLTKSGEGKLTATRNGEPFTSGSPAYEGDKIVITAQPAEGYQIDKWLIGKEEIEFTPYTGQTTFECTVGTSDVLIKATFAKKTFAVTLTKEGEGTLTATGAEDLTAVLYGTELTIVATPADGYELKALTANSTDILAAKKFTVTAATEVKASFTKKTAADVVESSSVRLYPNPASAYVNVKGAKADALVRLYDANGSLRYEARTDADGTLQIDLSAYTEGTYLLRVGNDAQRLLIQR